MEPPRVGERGVDWRIYTHTHTHTYIYTYTYICIHTHTHTHTYIYIYIYTYIYIYIHIYIYIYIHIHAHTHIYPPIYTPLPNSRWLHHTALRYVRKAQRGAYTWWKGLNSIKTRSKWAQKFCLSIPNGLGSLLEKPHFSPIFDPFLVPKRPIFKAFWDFPWPKTRHHGLKMC